MRPFFILTTFVLLLFSSCALLRQNPKYEFADGRYKTNLFEDKVATVYVHNAGDSISVFPLRKANKGFIIDTSVRKPVVFTAAFSDKFRLPVFRQNSFDVDFLTIPFKYRFPVEGFPRQLNANLNGAVYLGYRSDIYALHYPPTLLGRSERQTHHLGFSFGVFTGLGNTAMNPWVTNDRITLEYDGVVWSKGVASIIGLNNFTTGLAIGWDHLLERNKVFWIYQGKPWIGFVFGLNLN
jgi:hypothetical protein